MATAMMNLRVGGVGRGKKDIDRILSRRSFVADMLDRERLDVPTDDPLWTWNAPSFLTGKAHGTNMGTVEAAQTQSRNTHLHAQPCPGDKIDNVRLYFESLEEYERKKGGRTHYVIVFFFDIPATDGQVHELVNFFLERSFPTARGFAAAHRINGLAQVEVYLHCRQTDGRRIALSNREFRTLDETWAKLYADFAGANNIYARHMKKKRETRARKRESAEAGGNTMPAKLPRSRALPRKKGNK